MKIDLNSDLGEGFGRWKMGDDEALMKLISSVGQSTLSPYRLLPFSTCSSMRCRSW